MAGRRWNGRWLAAGALIGVVAVATVLFLTERRAGLPRSATCTDVHPGGVRLRAARPAATTPPDGGGGGAANPAPDADISPVFRPATVEAVYCEDLADPFVLSVGAIGPQFFAYGTNTDRAKVPVLISGGILRSERMTDALPQLPPWAEPGAVWAPTVLRRGRVFVLYYATTDAASGRQCISRAVGDDAEGPFEDTSAGPLVCPTELGGAIDPSPVVTPDGRAFLLWKADGNCCELPTAIYAQPISDDGLQVTGPPQAILDSTQPWEAGVVEAPAMIEHDGIYVLFYSGNAWNTANYAIGYAICDTPQGPCRKPLDQPWLGSSRKAAGPGSPELFTDGAGTLRMVFHAWLNGVVGYESGSFRSLYSLVVAFRDGAPIVGS